MKSKAEIATVLLNFIILMQYQFNNKVNIEQWSRVLSESFV